MELVSFSVPSRPDGKPLVIAPIGDIQYTGPTGQTVALDLLKRHIDRCLELDAYYIGMGDYIDIMSPSNRQRYRSAAFYDNVEDFIDNQVADLVEDLYERVLKPTSGRWIFLLAGHHLHQFRAGDTSDMRLCQKLGATFVGTSVFLRLLFSIHGSSRTSVVLWATHGHGGGAKVAAPLNKLEGLAAHFDADIFCVGHMSRLATAPLNRIVPRFDGHGAPDLTHKKVLLVGTGGFAKGYVVGARQGQVPAGGYVEQKMMGPVVLGAPIIYVDAKRLRSSDGKGKSRREMSVDLRVEI